jgi:hypothetical protein
LKLWKSTINPGCLRNDERQQGNGNASAVAPQPAEAGLARSHVRPRRVFRRSLRAALLATAVVAVSYSLLRHHGYVQRVELESLSASSVIAVAIDGAVSHTSWNPPIGMDRTNEALDRITIDFTPGLSTPERYTGFRQIFKARPVSLPVVPAQPAQNPEASAQLRAPAEQSTSLPAAPSEPRVALALPRDPDQIPGDSLSPDSTAKRRVAKARSLPEIDQYLWSVYQRSEAKRDRSGDFTWKDEAAAARLGLITKQYVIAGMDPDFRTLLYGLGQAMDAAGLNWTILSGFRDDYRQGLASGYKARVGNSFHGGSRATGGYGHGCAADIQAIDGESSAAVWKFVDQHGDRFGLHRPMKSNDPAHIQPLGGWHEVALDLREKNPVRTAYLPASVAKTDAEKLADVRSGVSEAQHDCVRSRRGSYRMVGFPHRREFQPGRTRRFMVLHPGRPHRFGRRRMFVEAGSAGKPTAEVELIAEKTGSDEKRVKAQASQKDKSRQEAKRSRSRAADGERSVKRPAREAQYVKGRKIADGKHPQKRAAKASERQAKAKSGVRVADQPDGFGKKL